MSSRHREEILKLARENVQLLVNNIFSQETRREAHAILAVLPDASTRLPREKKVRVEVFPFEPARTAAAQIPKPKPPTRWEKFAMLKGIQNRKRSRMVYDEAHDEYRPRWGYKRANNKEFGIIELNANDGALS